MKYTKVAKVPELNCKRRNRLQDFIANFMDDEDVRQAKIEYKPGEYKSPYRCYQSLWLACKRSHRRVKCVYRKGEVFLVKE